MEGSYVKALYDFVTNEPGEINLGIGDIIKVVRKVNADWLCGQLNKQIGNFPASFVAPLHLPNVKPGEKLFVATRTFPAEMQGDLGFTKGDIVLGVKAIDANWWQGSIANKTGIFPVTHVRELPAPNSGPEKQQQQQQPQTNDVIQNTPQNNAPVSGPIAKVRATMDLTAQLDDELSFFSGDIINVIQIVDEDFCIGECHGNSGQFPIAFVEVIEGDLSMCTEKSGRRRSGSKFRWWVDEEDEDVGDDPKHQPDAVHQDPTSNIPASHPAIPAVSNHTTTSNNTVQKHEPPKENSTSVLNTTDSVEYREKQDSGKQSHRRVGSYNQENTRSYDSDITPYGKTLYPFIAENPNELTFFDNEIVNLIQHVDEQWMEGEIDGKRGIFPTAYVDIIVDCPYADDILQQPAKVPEISQSETPSQNQNDKSEEVIKRKAEEETPLDKPELEGTPIDKYGLVLYDFHPNSEREMALKEGDTVTLLTQLDEHWYEAKHDDGREGLCPTSYIKVIEEDSCPPTTPKTPLEGKPSSNSSSFDYPDAHQTSISSKSDISQEKSPSVSAKPSRPSLRPKPSLKPKPVGVSSSPAQSEKPNLPPRKSVSLDTDNEYRPNPRPVIPARRLSERKSSMNKKSASVDTTLDDLISSEMNALKGDNVPPKTFGKSSSIRSAPPDLSREPRSPDESYMYKGKAVGSSMFFGANSPPSENPPKHVSFSGQQSRPTPARPPPPPASLPHLRRQNSLGKTAPARPSAPAPSVPSRFLPNGSDMEYGMKPVPARPAPPRPNPSRPPAPSRTSGNLMDFSPEKPIDGLSEQDQEIVADLDNRIAEIQKDLENCIQARQDLEHVLTVAEGPDKADAEESYEFYNANITGLTQEMQQLKASIYEIQPNRARADAAAEQRALAAKQRAEEERRQADMEKQQQEELRQKRHLTREKVIEEILQTERDFLHSLSYTMETFLRADAEKCAGVDLDTLFGNMDEVVEVSQMLLSSLEGATGGREFDKQIIGESFIKYKEDMKKVYAPYCRNHDDVINLIGKYEENEEMQDYFNRMVESMRQRIAVFDLGSMLIKPVQRILKYPLLLNELHKSTEDNHPDKEHLLNAINAMTDVAAAINEYKRRKDLVVKYKIDRDQKVTDKLARLSVHSTMKKLGRISQKLVGIQTIDEMYNAEERKFTALDKAARSVVRGVAMYVEHVQEVVYCQESLANDIKDYYDEKSGQEEVQQFCTVHNAIASHHYHTFKCDIEGEVLTPLNRLLTMFSAPAKVMKKRHDKLLDYDNAQGKVKSTKDAEQLRLAQLELQRVKNDYEALNAQLLDELPRLYDLALDIVRESITRFIIAQRHYHQRAIDEMYQLLSLPLILGMDGSNIIETFNIAHVAAVEALSDLSFIPRSFNPRVEETRTNKPSRRVSGAHSANSDQDKQQTDGQRVYLTQVYPMDRLYRVKVDSPVSQPMDLACSAGTVLGVIKEGDPMGNKDRWFVDNGAMKGFISKKVLSLYQDPQAVAAAVAATGSILQPQTEPLKPRSVSPIPPTDLMDLSSPPRELPPKATPIPVDLGFPSELQEKVALNDPTLEQSGVVEWGVTTPQQSQHHAPEEAPLAEPSPPPAYTEVVQPASEAQQPTCYRAVYPFTSRTPIEVSMAEGQLVTVLQKHDLDGNSEWWLVEVDGRQGYAPANYLYESQ